tara:strand:- start:36 stop:473 length:438 start_codon:yes stop_codon:yes gene_type:complete
MNYAIIDGTTVERTGSISQLFPSTLFPSSGVPEEFLTANNAVKIIETLSFTTPTQKLTTVDAYVEGGKAYTVKVESTTTEEQTNLTNAKWVEVRNHRNDLLSQSDWRALSDVTLSDVWRTYRQELRDIPSAQTDPYNITYPTPPS